MEQIAIQGGEQFPSALAPTPTRASVRAAVVPAARQQFITARTSADDHTSASAPPMSRIETSSLWRLLPQCEREQGVSSGDSDELFRTSGIGDRATCD